MNYILTTSGLSKRYKARYAAEDINIHIRKGMIYGLIGRNGAGKTTIMRMLSGLALPTAGSYQYFDSDGNPIRNLVGKVGTLIEAPGLYPKLSAYENIKIKCIAAGIPRAKIDATVRELLALVGLADTGKKQAGSFSLGMRQRLGIALALTGDPEIIILDEPINGLDPQGIVEMRVMLEKLRDEKGITIMISSHILDELSKLADAYGIIHEGRLIDEFTTDELAERCGEYITLKTPDLKAAKESLQKMGITQVEVDQNSNIRISEALDQTAAILKTLITDDVTVNELYVTRLSLEDYYLTITGGKYDA